MTLTSDELALLDAARAAAASPRPSAAATARRARAVEALIAGDVDRRQRALSPVAAAVVAALLAGGAAATTAWVLRPSGAAALSGGGSSGDVGGGAATRATTMARPLADDATAPDATAQDATAQDATAQDATAQDATGDEAAATTTAALAGAGASEPTEARVADTSPSTADAPSEAGANDGSTSMATSAAHRTEHLGRRPPTVGPAPRTRQTAGLPAAPAAAPFPAPSPTAATAMALRPEPLVDDDSVEAGDDARRRWRDRCVSGLRHRRDHDVLDDCRRFGDRFPDDEVARTAAFAAGGLAEELGLLDEAARAYARAIVLSSADGQVGDALFARARVQAARGELDDARADLGLFLHRVPHAVRRDDVQRLARALRVQLPSTNGAGDQDDAP
jgi:hypothetical protein